jgi:hypothetical protein
MQSTAEFGVSAGVFALSLDGHSAKLYIVHSLLIQPRQDGA